MTSPAPSFDVTPAGEEPARYPCVAALGVPVAAVVHKAHEETLDAALAHWRPLGLDKTSLEPILVYCAEQRCLADAVTCPGCRLRADREGLTSLDDLLARYAQVRTRDGRLSVSGPGQGVLEAASLEALATTWSGQEYWFWARRVLRKLRHGIRRASQSGAPPEPGREAPVLVLVRPQLADNIGMAARAMANFGLEEMRLVDPRDGWPNDKARIAASGANYIIDVAEYCPTFTDGVAGLNWICATSARQRDLAKPVLTPAQAVAEIRQRIAAGQRCGIVFGPERNGLETHEIANADAHVMVPVNPNFASLNLAQAVLLMGYEWMKQAGGGTLGRVTTFETPLQPGLRLRGSQPAGKEALLALFEHLEAELEAARFFTSPEKRPSTVQNIRSMFTRMGATEQEIRTLRGIVKALVHGRRTKRQPP
ncbi:MAG: RNA methyltransferase [Hyphomicrobiaceae bacterium]|nr:RNA methyltransferase [Hyphomicrobiaceae bacterium]